MVHGVMRYCVETGKTDFDGMGCFGGEFHNKIRAGGGALMTTYIYINITYTLMFLSLIHPTFF